MPETATQVRQLGFGEAIREAIAEEMRRDSRIVLMGEDVAEALIEEGQAAPAEARLRQAIRAFPAEAKKESAASMRRLAGLWESQGKNADAGRALRQRADALDPPKP